MLVLDNHQIEKVKDRLSRAGVHSDSLSIDLVDHICCMIEERLNSGTKLQKAENEVFAVMGETHLKNIELETDYLTQNKSKISI